MDFVSGLDLGQAIPAIQERQVGNESVAERHTCGCGCGNAVRGTGSRYCRGHNLNASRPAAERFGGKWKTVGDCWEWQGEALTCGYGRIRVGRRKKLAHRFSYELFRGPIPDGLFVCHHCDNRRCVNPDHLFLGTNADNMRDMVNKGRSTVLPGEDNPNAKLSADEAREVIRLRSAGIDRKSVAERFGISKTMVTFITTGRSWKCLRTSAA